jgi:hypothetical protein
MTTSEQELLETIEEIRAREFPGLPADLVKQIVMIETDFTENRHEAYRCVSQAIGEYLASTPEG